jgi:hypothetical protein
MESEQTEDATVKAKAMARAKSDLSMATRHGQKVAGTIRRLTGLPVSYSVRHGLVVMDTDVAAAWLRERGLDG